MSVRWFPILDLERAAFARPDLVGDDAPRYGLFEDPRPASSAQNGRLSRSGLDG